MIAAALPYVTLPSVPNLPIQPYGLIVLAAMILGSAAMVRAANRMTGMPSGDSVLFAVVLVGGSFVGAHVFDVAVYRWSEAMERPFLWAQMFDGISLFGAVIATAALTWIWTRARKLALAPLADVVAFGALVATVIGRIGCALVHDHPGKPTELPIGVDFPVERTWFLREPPAGATIRLHDTGLEELALLLPLLVVAWRLTHRALRPGVLAALVAFTYAAIRFPLDFLRHPETETYFAGLTMAQWCSLAMAALVLLLYPRNPRDSR